MSIAEVQNKLNTSFVTKAFDHYISNYNLFEINHKTKPRYCESKIYLVLFVLNVRHHFS